MNVSKYSIGSVLSLIFSPILSLPVLIYNIYKRDKISFYLLSVVIGTFSLLYVPYFTDDKVRHIERFLEISSLGSISDLFYYIKNNNLPDFVSYLLMFITGKISNNPNLFFFTTAATTFLLFSHVFYKIFTKHRPNSFKFLYFVFFIVSFDYVFLFSGVRFYLASSFVIYGWYLLFYEKNKYGACLFFILAMFTHFAASVIILPYLLVYFYPKMNFKLLFLCSLFFLLIPSEYIYKVISLLPLSSSYLYKAYDYLMYTDIQLSAAEDANVFKILLYFKNSWFYIISLFLLLNKNFKTILQNTLYSLLALRCVFGNMPTITHYYDLVIIFTIVLFSFEIYNFNKASKFLYIILMYFILSFFIEIYKCRESFIISNFNIKNLYSVSLFMSERPSFIQFSK